MGSMATGVEEIGAAAAPQAVERRLGELRATFESGRTRPLSWRQSQLRGLLRLLADKEEEAFRALHADLGKHRAEAYRDEVLPPSSQLHRRTPRAQPSISHQRHYYIYNLYYAGGFGGVQVGVLTKSANAALREIGKWVAPEKASSTHYLVTLQCILFIRIAHRLLLEPNSAVLWTGRRSGCRWWRSRRARRWCRSRSGSSSSSPAGTSPWVSTLVIENQSLIFNLG